MFELVADIGSKVFINVLQLIAGCLLSVPLYYYVSKIKGKFRNSSFYNFLYILVFSVSGLVLPLGLYGFIPVIFSLLALGIGEHLLISLIVTNACFNMLVPISDFVFTWKTGIIRLVFALIAGISAGLLLSLIGGRNKCFFRDKLLPEINFRRLNLSFFLNTIRHYIYTAGIFVVAGAIMNVVLHREALVSIISFFTSNASASPLLRFLNGYNVTAPLFLLALSVLYMFMDIVKLSALLYIFKPKGLVFYFLYYSSWALLLGSTIFVFK